MSCQSFLSSNAQDFIEDLNAWVTGARNAQKFLSSNAQDFIEDGRKS